jgi:hypothetical protein
MILNHIFNCEQIPKKWQDPSNKKNPPMDPKKKHLSPPSPKITHLKLKLFKRFHVTHNFY